MLAPHLAETQVAAHPTEQIIKLTLDRNLQASLEDLATEQARLLAKRSRPPSSSQIIRRGKFSPQVGSAGYMDVEPPRRRRHGDGRALARLDVEAIHLWAGIRSRSRTSRNVDRGQAGALRYVSAEELREGYHGTVSIREALSQSFNIPAVRVLARVGPGKLVGRFRRAGVMARFPDKSEPTLAMALGGTGLTLQEMAQLYASLARGGDSITFIRSP